MGVHSQTNHMAYVKVLLTLLEKHSYVSSRFVPANFILRPVRIEVELL